MKYDDTNAGAVTGCLVAVASGVGLAHAASVFLRKQRDSASAATNLANKGQAVGRSGDGVALSPIQEFFMELQDGGNDHIVCCVEIEGHIPSDGQLLKSIQRLKLRHASLRTVLALTERNEIRQREEQGDIDEPKSGELSIVRDKTWNDVVQSCLDQVQFPKPTSGSPVTVGWKVTLVTPPHKDGDNNPQAAIVFRLNHVLFDGTSRNRLVHEFFCSLRPDVDKNLVEGSLPFVDVRQLTQTIRTMRWTSFLWNCVGIIRRELWNCRRVWYFPLTKEQTPALMANSENAATPRTRICTWALSEAETTRLVQRSRKEKTTVHGAVSAAGHRALVRLANEMNPGIHGGAYFSTCHLISLWPFVSKSLPRMYPDGVSIGGLLIDIFSIRASTALDQDPWSLAREIKSQLRQYRPLSHPQRLLQSRLVNFLQSISQSSPPDNYATLKLVGLLRFQQWPCG